MNKLNNIITSFCNWDMTTEEQENKHQREEKETLHLQQGRKS